MFYISYFYITSESLHFWTLMKHAMLIWREECCIQKILLLYIWTEKSTRNIPIIMLTAKSSEYDIVNGLDCGADDYITKPFGNRILIARIKAQLRKANSGKLIVYKELVINTLTHTAKLNNKILELTYSEFEILSSLAGYPERVYTRSELISMLRGDDGYDITERAIDVQIVNLRRKLGDFGAEYIKTVRGIGYKLGGAE